MKRRFVVVFVALVTAVGIGFLFPVSADSGAVALLRLNGQDVTDGSADAVITDSTLLLEGAARTGPKALVDAGSSSAVRQGTPAQVLGVALRGQPPYRFAWSYGGSADRFGSPADQGSSFDTTGLEGPQTLTLTVTDTLGESASDDVKVFVQVPTDAVLLDVTAPTGVGVPDEHLAASGTDGSDLHYSIDVPANSDSLDVSLEWANPANDFDVRLRDPSGAADRRTDAAGGSMPEVIRIDRPAAGRWTVEVDAYANVPDEVHLRALSSGVTPDPTPQLDANGPYRFIESESHDLNAAVSGGTAPLITTWDVDGDGASDSAGTNVSGRFPLGLTFVTVKTTDSAGYEKREVVPVRVAERWDYASDTAPLVVVGVADSGLNIYHREFRAETYPDPRVLELTNNFTRHPSEYIPGFPKTAEAIDLTLTNEYHPTRDQVVDANDGRISLAEVAEGKLYWIPGTKIVGAYDAGEATFINSTAGDTVPLLDEDGHGTGSASVAVGNIYGYCPTCLLVVTESSDEGWQYGSPWIDITSNSFGAGANASLSSEPAVPRVSAERGQIALYAAGNGNENAFVTPMQTYLSDTLGPAWSLRVGAVERGTRKPIVGTGKPVDVASWGSGDIPAADHLSVDGTGSHSGTSAATPYTAGVMGTVLGKTRERLGDQRTGQRPQVGPGVIATGPRVATSPYLADGRLTRTELVQAVLKTAEHDNGDDVSVYPATTPNNERQYLVEGYGIVEPASGERAIDVLLGDRPLPDRSAEDRFFEEDAGIRTSIWGTWAGGGADSSRDPGAPTARPAPQPNPLEGVTFGAAVTRPQANDVIDVTDRRTRVLAGLAAFPRSEVAAASTRYYFHRTTGTVCNDGRFYLDRTNSDGDYEPACAAGPVNGVLDAIGSANTEPFALDASELPAALGSGAATGRVVISPATTQGVQIPASPAQSIDVRLIAGDELLGSVTVTKPVVTPNTPFDFSIPIPADAVGARLTSLTVEVVPRFGGTPARTELDGPEVSYVDLPLGKLPVELVELTVDDPGFTTPSPASVSNGRFALEVDLSILPDGDHTLYARAVQGDARSAAFTVPFKVTRSVATAAPVTKVQARVESLTGRVRTAWIDAADTSGRGDFGTWAASVPLGKLENGRFRVVTRLVDPAGQTVAQDSATFEVRRKR